MNRHFDECGHVQDAEAFWGNVDWLRMGHDAAERAARRERMAREAEENGGSDE